MDRDATVAKIKDLISGAHDVLIVTHEHPTFDSIGSSLALQLGLASLGKRVTIACPDPMTVELSSFVGVNRIASDIGKKNFVISLDYVEGSIEKVSYNIDGNTFNLVIEPRVGFPPFSEDKVHYSNASGSADVIIAIDTIHLGGLRKLYEENKELFVTKPVVNVDRHPNNGHFGQVNMVDSQASTTAELVGQLLQGLGVTFSEDIATNLLNALYGGTNSFQNSAVTAAAFEVAASCLKAGGRRFRRPLEAVATQSAVTPGPVVRPSQPPVSPQGQAGQTPRLDAASGPVQAPADWLKPKIFKSSNLV